MAAAAGVLVDVPLFSLSIRAGVGQAPVWVPVASLPGGFLAEHQLCEALRAEKTPSSLGASTESASSRGTARAYAAMYMPI